MATRKTAADWSKFLADPERLYTLEEMAVIEQLMLRERRDCIEQPIMDSIATSLASMKSTMQRLDGRLERIELYLCRKDPSYPLSQREAPEYRAFKRLVRDYDEAQQEIIAGGGGDD